MLGGAAALASSAMDVAGSIYQNKQISDMSGKQMRFADSQSRIQREWQERMANTAYQRAVADMKAAGINPMLMASKGFQPSSTPPISSASPPGVSSPSAPKMDLASALTLAKNLENIQSQTDLNKANALVAANNATVLAHSANKAKLDVELKKNDLKRSNIDTGIESSNAGQIMNWANRILNTGQSALGLFNPLKGLFSKKSTPVYNKNVHNYYS